MGVRFRQQINENSKMLCWHHVIPEMNHNELLGWRTNTDNLAVVYFRNKCDYIENQVHIDINKEVIAKYTNNITEISGEKEIVRYKTLCTISISAIGFLGIFLLA